MSSRLAIPTSYRGTLFRSRLEARWAAFLDLIAWPWEYEPIDLAGYIPDFICAHDAGDLLVEVKPATTLEALREHTEKIERSGWTKEAMLVGAALWEPSSAQPICGLIGHGFDAPWGREWEWSTARAFRCLCCGGVSVLADEDSWHCRRCHCAADNIGDVESLVEVWGAAGARVQWRPGT